VEGVRVGACSPEGPNQGEIKCCSKVGTTRNTSTSCNKKEKKKKTTQNKKENNKLV